MACFFILKMHDIFLVVANNVNVNQSFGLFTFQERETKEEKIEAVEKRGETFFFF